MKLLKISLIIVLAMVMAQCKTNNNQEVFTGEVKGFPMFIKEGEDIIGIPCHNAELITKGHNGQIDSVFIEFNLNLVRLAKLNRGTDYFSDIVFPEEEDGFFTVVRFKAHANEAVCKQLSEDYANSKDKSPIDILLYREVPNVPYHRKIINYEITEWNINKIAY